MLVIALCDNMTLSLQRIERLGYYDNQIVKYITIFIKKNSKILKRRDSSRIFKLFLKDFIQMLNRKILPTIRYGEYLH